MCSKHNRITAIMAYKSGSARDKTARKVCQTRVRKQLTPLHTSSGRLQGILFVLTVEGKAFSWRSISCKMLAGTDVCEWKNKTSKQGQFQRKRSLLPQNQIALLDIRSKNDNKYVTAKKLSFEGTKMCYCFASLQIPSLPHQLKCSPAAWEDLSCVVTTLNQRYWSL